jgi:hypothetical protein
MDDVAIPATPLQSVATPGITTVLTIIVPTLNERENIEPLCGHRGVWGRAVAGRTGACAQGGDIPTRADQTRVHTEGQRQMSRCWRKPCRIRHGKRYLWTMTRGTAHPNMFVLSAQPTAALSSTDRPARSRNSLHRRCARFLLALHRDNGCRSPAR